MTCTSLVPFLSRLKLTKLYPCLSYFPTSFGYFESSAFKTKSRGQTSHKSNQQDVCSQFLKVQQLRVTFFKNDTKSSNLIFDPLRFCSCLVEMLVLVRNWKISKLSWIDHVLFELWTPQVCPKIHSKCKIRCENN